jgi:hypothetical protein
MQTDRYTKIVLTVIAVCQIIGVIRTVPPIPIIQQAMAHTLSPAMSDH